MFLVAVQVLQVVVVHLRFKNSEMELEDGRSFDIQAICDNLSFYVNYKHPMTSCFYIVQIEHLADGDPRSLVPVLEELNLVANLE